MTAEAARAPTRLPPDCDAPPVRHQGPIWPQGNEHRSKCLVNAHANWPLTPPLRRIGRQQSVRWGEGRRTRTTARSPDRGRQRHREVKAKRPRSGALRRGVRSACDSERPTTVTHGQSWALGGCRHESAGAAFALIRALETCPELVVRGRVELPTFRFSGRVTSGIPVSGQSERSRRASSSLHDCLGRVRRVKAKPHAVASRALTRQPRPEGRQLSRRTGEDQGTAIRAGRTAVRRAISGPLTPVTSGLSRSLADTPLRRSGNVTGPDGTASQADSAGSIPGTRSTAKAPGEQGHPPGVAYGVMKEKLYFSATPAMAARSAGSSGGPTTPRRPGLPISGNMASIPAGEYMNNILAGPSPTFR